MRALVIGAALLLGGCVHGEACVDGAERDESGTCRLGEAGVDAGMDAASDTASDTTVDVAGDTPTSDAADAGDAGPTATIVDIAVGNFHKCVIDEDGTLWCEGANNFGQLGVEGAPMGWVNPFASFDPAVAIASVSTKRNTTCARSRSDALYCWGENDNGEVGAFVDIDGDEARDDRVFAPTRVEPPAGSSGWKSVDVGLNTVCGIADGDTIHCWGDNDRGQCGVDNVITREQASPSPAVRGFVGEIDELQAAQVVVGDMFACALRADGDGDRVQCWGNPGNERYPGAGLDHEGSPLNEVDIIHLSATTTHTCAARSGRPAICWGRNMERQISDPPGSALAAANIGLSATSVFAGPGYTCVNDGGVVSCQGINDEGQLGQGSMTSPLGPVPIADLNVMRMDVSGSGRTCALETEGRLWCWGQGDVTPVEQVLP